MTFLFPVIVAGACAIALADMLYAYKCWRCSRPFAIHQQHMVTGRGLCWRCASKSGVVDEDESVATKETSRHIRGTPVTQSLRASAYRISYRPASGSHRRLRARE